MTNRILPSVTIGLFASWAYGQAPAGLWLNQFGTSQGEWVHDVGLLGPSSAAVAVGATAGPLGGPNAGSLDIFVTRFSPHGEVVWVRQLGTTTLDAASSVSCNGGFAVYVGGETLGDLAGPNAGEFDAVVLRLDADGNTAWVHQFGTSESDSVLSVCADPLAGLFVGGITEGALTGSSFGSADGFLARYNIFGQRQWMRQLGTAGGDSVQSVVVDGTNVIVAA